MTLGACHTRIVLGSTFVSGQWQPTRWSHADARPPITLEDPPRPRPFVVVMPRTPEVLL